MVVGEEPIQIHLGQMQYWGPILCTIASRPLIRRDRELPMATNIYFTMHPKLQRQRIQNTCEGKGKSIFGFFWGLFVFKHPHFLIFLT